MRWKRWATGAGAVVVVAMALVLLLPSADITDTRFSAYSDSDEDASFVVNGLRGQGFEVTSLLLGPGALKSVDPAEQDAIYLTIGVDRGYTGAELDDLFNFVDRGGTAIVLDDIGASQALLDRIGVQRGALLLATTGNEASVVPVQIGSTIVELWEPTALEVTDADVRVLGQAQNLTAKDVDGDGQVGAEDPTCNPGCPVAVEATVGQGRIVYVSDATFATDRFADRSGAIQLLQALADEATGQSTRALLIVDESRHVSGVSEVGLTAFRALMAPLDVALVPWLLVGLTGIVTVASHTFRGDEGWAVHEPGLEDPYLAPGSLSQAAEGSGEEATEATGDPVAGTNGGTPP